MMIVKSIFIYRSIYVNCKDEWHEKVEQGKFKGKLPINYRNLKLPNSNKCKKLEFTL